MKLENKELIEGAKKAALEVLLHNAEGPFNNLPRTAGWGYPEPYTRDLLISVLGIAATKNPVLINSMRKVLETLSLNQSKKGHIPSLVHDKDDRGASDTTPLFLIAVAIFREIINEPYFLKDAVNKALLWMDYQSPSDRYLVAQQPTSDWRDEQWVPGYGLFVNTLVYTYLKLLGVHDKAENLRNKMESFTITAAEAHHHVHEGLAVKNKPYYAFWSYKMYSSERFDLLGNSLAILSGIAPRSRAIAMTSWIEKECQFMVKKGELAPGLTPNFFPYIKPGEIDWHPRYENFNQPGEYHNGGVWPFISGFYIAALVAVGKFALAERKLLDLTKTIKLSRKPELEYGFNEWYKAQNGKPMGQDWQTWSASNYLYAAKCVEDKSTPFFDKIRQ
ncbi:amylo-alpha-1,6-glucosidase [Christiangramia fulva]|uniref:beta-fructofuranosidase n=1 Tax=Christiangramia fulva TaxID=2126553 RepID=A0A2R3Z4C5_9FLAO|nr:glycoside hydrolase 100 family protein [Christiangramia fulva]AVR45115.1 amylo-alpha-1,6-glucosidase [Christiangramia fulva]